jgi:hypothetical protein
MKALRFHAIPEGAHTILMEPLDRAGRRTPPLVINRNDIVPDYMIAKGEGVTDHGAAWVEMGIAVYIELPDEPETSEGDADGENSRPVD